MRSGARSYPFYCECLPFVFSFFFLSLLKIDGYEFAVYANAFLARDLRDVNPLKGESDGSRYDLITGWAERIGSHETIAGRIPRNNLRLKSCLISDKALTHIGTMEMR